MPNVPHFVPGIVPAPYDPRDEQYAVRVSLEETRRLPVSYDGRKNYPMPLPDQGRYGTCAEHAANTELRKAELAKHRAGVGIDELSYAYPYDLVRELMGTFPRDSGTDMRLLCKVMQKGLPTEAQFPYTQRNLTIPPTQDFINTVTGHKLLSYHRIPQTQAAHMAVMSRGAGAIIGIAVYESMLTEEVARTGIVPMPSPQTGDRLAGYHCVGEAGYDQDGVWFPNWWGDWGVNGFGKLPWALILSPKLCVDAYGFDIVQ